MAAASVIVCPGCGLAREATGAAYDRKFHASAECWSVFESVIAEDFQDPAVFGACHQLTVDAYAVQHAGGEHPDKSVCIHLCGLYLVLEEGLRPTDVPPRLQRIAKRSTWPHLRPPGERAPLTIGDVPLAAPFAQRVQAVRAWAGEVWASWEAHHETARELCAELAGHRR